MIELMATIGVFSVGWFVSSCVRRAVVFCQIVHSTKDGLARLEKEHSDLYYKVIFDTAGRLKTLEDKMAELVKGEAD